MTVRLLLSITLLTAISGQRLVAQGGKPPFIDQPARPSGVTSGTYGPQTPPRLTTRTTTAGRAAHSDTTEILEALAGKLRVEARDVLESTVAIKKDTAWVTLTNPKFRGETHRLERGHSWKVVE